jgi:HEAT repeat protein
MFLTCACLLAQVAVAFADEDVPTLIKELHARNADRRLKAAQALTNLGPDAKDAVPALIHALKTDRDSRVRIWAANALGRIGPAAKDGVPALIDASRADSEIIVRRASAMSLGQIGPDAKDAVPALLDALKDSDEWLPGAAAGALGAIVGKMSGPAAKDAVSALVDVLTTESKASARRWVAGILGKMSGPAAKDAVPALLDALKDSDLDVRRTAVDSLGQIGPAAKDAVPALLDALKDGDRNTREWAAVSLGKIHARPKVVIPALIEVLKTNGGAVQAIGAFGPQAKDAVPALIDALQDEAPYGAVDALGAIGPDAKDALPALRALLRKSKDDDELRGTINEAIQKIRVEAGGAAAPPSERTTFTYTNELGTGTFKNTRGTRWLEHCPNGDRLKFEEVTRNSRYIEIYDKDRDVGVRIYRNKTLWRNPEDTRGKWLMLWEGEWTE